MTNWNHNRLDEEIDDINEDAFDDETDRIVNNHSRDSVKLRRTESTNNPVLHRALSTVSANQSLVFNQRTTIAKNFRRSSVNDQIVTINHVEADASFVLTDLNSLKEEIRTRVMDSLVDQPTMTALEETSKFFYLFFNYLYAVVTRMEYIFLERLNWWCSNKLQCPKLYPLLTSGDGNCLLHATSLAMWGFQDRSLVMRKALNETLITSKPNNSLYRRWRWAQSVQNKKYGLVFSEEEWDSEWKSLLKLSSTEPRTYQCKTSNSTANNNSNVFDDSNRNPKLPNTTTTTTSNVITSYTPSSMTNTTTTQSTSTNKTSPSTTVNNNVKQYYESLEEMHVYVLANNIRRPIIVYSDTILRDHSGEAVSPINFGGIYFPLEIPPEKCYQSPVFLAFDAAHFSALVPMEQNSKMKLTYRIPLIDADTLDLLPLHFAVDPGPSFRWPINEELSDNVIQQYELHGERRLKLLEKYLSLCKEFTSLTTLFPSTSTANGATPSTASFTQQQMNEESNNIDMSTTNVSEMNESLNSATSAIPNINKKIPKPLNNFGKIIRRAFIEPFSQSKRAAAATALRNEQQMLGDAVRSQNASTFENENDDEYLNQSSLSLLNPRTNILTVIMVNFQPKRPRACDSMIKNYIDTCIREYREELIKQQRQNTDVNDIVKEQTFILPRQQTENNNSYNRNVTTTNNDSVLRISKNNNLAINQPSSSSSAIVNNSQQYSDFYTKNKDNNASPQPIHSTVRSIQTRNSANNSPNLNEKNINLNNQTAIRKLPQLPSQSSGSYAVNVNSLTKQSNINYQTPARSYHQVVDNNNAEPEEENKFSTQYGYVRTQEHQQHPRIADVPQSNSSEFSNRHQYSIAPPDGYSYTDSKLNGNISSYYESKNGNSQKPIQMSPIMTPVKRQQSLNKIRSTQNTSINSINSPTRIVTPQMIDNNRYINNNNSAMNSYRPSSISRVALKNHPPSQTSTWYAQVPVNTDFIYCATEHERL
ncbi:unnamed protein product [Didymodactylos carnosus]|uniref:ubiquitinyl hydrolase 1 n=1 Tax=Didymodactylos carnosus TaxID=1234261 RepID=A0A8S2DCC0_9BILA|nr:unnamed protein product [Didymodactylos carnosus]CAF3651860.1 unnamed protein product [Didymodactylos carnosus]